MSRSSSLRPEWAAFIRANAHQLKDAAIAAILSRLAGYRIPKSTVASWRRDLGLKKDAGHGVCRLRRPPENEA